MIAIWSSTKENINEFSAERCEIAFALDNWFSGRSYWSYLFLIDIYYSNRLIAALQRLKTIWYILFKLTCCASWFDRKSFNNICYCIGCAPLRKKTYYIEVPRPLYHCHSNVWKFYFAYFYNYRWFASTVCPNIYFTAAKYEHSKMSDSKIITWSIYGELLGIDSENACYSFIKRSFRHIFPKICYRTRFNRTRKAILQMTKLIRQKLISLFPIPSSRYFVIDIFSLPVCKFERVRYCPSLRANNVNYGRYSSKKETY